MLPHIQLRATKIIKRTSDLQITSRATAMVSEKRPRVVLWPRLEPFEFGIFHCQDRGAIAKLNAAVRVLLLQLTRTLFYCLIASRLVFEEVRTAH